VNQRIIYQRDGHDDWQPPDETLALGYGDCEDIALLKLDLVGWFYKLFNTADLLLVHIRQSQEDHAVLLINNELVMDSRSDGVHELRDLTPYYEPRCMISKEGLFIFKPEEPLGGQNVPSV
jgi:predicted transglutaminase-like cysteine proteinase